MTTIVRSVALAALVAAAPALRPAFGPAPAAAHRDFAAVPAQHLTLSKSNPADGATVASVSEIRLWFSAPPMDMGAGSVELRILDADGKVVATGNPVRDKKDAKVYALALPRGLEPKSYRIAWETMAADGDAAKGEFRFTVRAS